MTGQGGKILFNLGIMNQFGLSRVGQQGQQGQHGSEETYHPALHGIPTSAIVVDKVDASAPPMAQAAYY
jgi:hypothetical protein